MIREVDVDGDGEIGKFYLYIALHIDFPVLQDFVFP